MPSTHTPSSEPANPHLGPALRHLRLMTGRKQQDVAAEATVTRAMLSSYENSRQAPTLATLLRLLEALDADFAALQWALDLVAAGPAGESGPGEGSPRRPPRSRPVAPAGAPPPEVGTDRPVEYRIVDLPELSSEEQQLLGHLLAGFLSWLRYSRRYDPET